MKEVALHSERARVGLVLSGGGASAAYQAGVVRALAELDVRIQAVAGTSAGALNGAVVAESDGDLRKATKDLDAIWRSLVGNSPIEFQPGKFILNVAVTRLLAGSNPLATAVLTEALNRAGLLELAPADVEALGKVMDRGIERVLRGEGLPFYVSVLESEDIVTDVSAAVFGYMLDLWDTPPSKFRHIQSLPKEERKATILASAAIPIVLQARRLGSDGRRYVDGGLGGWRERQGLTPATPLVEQAGCTHLIITHASDNTPWRRDRIPDTEVIEIRPGRTMRRTEGFMGDTRDMFNFSGDIASWIEQGYEDAIRCVGYVKRATGLVRESREARARRDRALDALDEDGFGSV